MEPQTGLRRVILLLSLALCGCGAVTNSTVAFREDSLRDSSDAIIYVYRLRSVVGAAVPLNVRLDGKIVGVLRQDAYMALHLPAGEHSLRIGDSESPIVLGPGVRALAAALEATSGKFILAPRGVYYLRSQGLSVTFLTREDAMAELSSMMLDTGSPDH
jgi:hypothetical protein